MQSINIDFLQIFNFIDKIGAIAVLLIIIYYGKDVVEEIILKHNNHIDEMFKKYEILQKETHGITKEAIKSISRNNIIYPKIEEILDILQNNILKKKNKSKNNKPIKKKIEEIESLNSKEESLVNDLF